MNMKMKMMKNGAIATTTNRRSPRCLYVVGVMTIILGLCPWKGALCFSPSGAIPRTTIQRRAAHVQTLHHSSPQQKPPPLRNNLILGASISSSSNTTIATTTSEELLTSPPYGTTAVQTARVLFVAGSMPSGYGQTSPEPNPTWTQVATQLAKRLPHFGQSSDADAGASADTDTDTSSMVAKNDGTIDLIQTNAMDVTDLQASDLTNVDVLVVLGVASLLEESMLMKVLESSSSSSNKLQAILCDPTCSPNVLGQRFTGRWRASSEGSFSSFVTHLAPWSTVASHQRLLAKTDTLLARKSSEDYLFATLFIIHALVVPMDVVKSDINPSWEKGVGRNIQEFQSMVNCCGPEIQAALSDPQSKKAIDLLNDVDLRDQVGSYRVIVSNETPQLEAFTLCILQQNNCFQCDAPILTQPKVPLLETWRGKPLDAHAAQHILMGHLEDDHHPSAPGGSESGSGHVMDETMPWSWKIVVGANPAYDAFPMQHQLFYPSGRPSGSSVKSLWYDPVFCVETLDGELVWCKRHYRCTPRSHWSGRTAGAWTLTTLDNGMVSEEHWTTVDAADDLSWTVLHYSGAARRAGQSYVGALLCSPDGQWPTAAVQGTAEYERIRTAFRQCDLELWELFGGSTTESYMWSSQFTDWAEQNPPPLDRIGDVSITTWRKRELKKEELAATAAVTAASAATR